MTTVCASISAARFLFTRDFMDPELPIIAQVGKKSRLPRNISTFGNTFSKGGPIGPKNLGTSLGKSNCNTPAFLVFMCLPKLYLDITIGPAYGKFQLFKREPPSFFPDNLIGLSHKSPTLIFEHVHEKGGVDDGRSLDGKQDEENAMMH